MKVVAIDGPAGSGKSTTARAAAERLGLAHLDSGALYRAMTLAALDNQVPLDGQRIVALARALPVRLALVDQRFRPEVAGTDVSHAIRRPDVTGQVSAVSALPAVRELVNALLREAAAIHPRGVVVDGRDIGTVVFPDAALKVFLTAQPEARARRRLAQEGRALDPAAVRVEAERLGRRDDADARRPVAPLKVAPDAMVLDTTDLSFEEQVVRIVELARNTLGNGPA
jgi:cytidylate kinase